MMVWIGSSEENMVPELALRAHSMTPGWNGLPVPLVSAVEFRAFIEAWRRNDPNGSWNTNGVMVIGSELVYSDGEGYDDSWPVYGYDDNGVALYALSGWNWVEG